jgi:hypothetical protein
MEGKVRIVLMRVGGWGAGLTVEETLKVVVRGAGCEGVLLETEGVSMVLGYEQEGNVGRIEGLINC